MIATTTITPKVTKRPVTSCGITSGVITRIMLAFEYQIAVARAKIDCSVRMVRDTQGSNANAGFVKLSAQQDSSQPVEQMYKDLEDRRDHATAEVKAFAEQFDPVECVEGAVHDFRPPRFVVGVLFHGGMKLRGVLAGIWNRPG